MHAVDLIEEAQQLAESIGFEVRREWLGEKVGGACRLGQRWVLFSDLSLSANEQLEQLVNAIRSSPLLPAEYNASSPLRRLIRNDAVAER
jgi:hypothetical protein